MSNFTRTSEQFLAAKAKGQKAEKAFIDLIAVMGGAASALGTIPAHGDQTPRFSHPHATNEKGYWYSVSPDIVFTLPNQPKGFASLAQIKIKKLQSDPSKGWFYVYLDEAELHRMKFAAQFYDVFFIINIPELDGIKGFSEWMWVNVEDLQKDQTTLIRRTICDKPTFLLPLNLFKPLSEITKRKLNEPANSNAIPTTPTARKGDHLSRTEA